MLTVHRPWLWLRAVSVGGLTVLLVIAWAFAAGWINGPAPGASASAAGSSATASVPPSEGATASPTPTQTPARDVALAVATTLTDPREGVSLTELQAGLADGSVVVPCGLDTLLNAAPPGECVPVQELPGRASDPNGSLALIPLGLVDPWLKVLAVDGADLFGSPAARAQRYPVMATTSTLPPELTDLDPSRVRNVIVTGETCADRGVAYAAITRGHGWPWVFDGGTARYTRIYPNPAPPDVVGNGYNIVDAQRTGYAGAVATLVSGADLTLGGYECPVHHDFTIAQGMVFGTDPAIPPLLAERLGWDVVTLGANHITDQGAAALAETLLHFDEADIQHTGAGMNLDEALEPAIVVSGDLRIGVVGLNVVPGAWQAGTKQPGAAYITPYNAATAVERARDGGANLVICMPEWGWPEYHAELTDDQHRLKGILYDAGCDQILGRGTHWVGGIELERHANGTPRLTVGSQGNFIFGQGWSQETSEGMLVELSFVGTTLAQVRLHPYTIMEQAQPNLLDPAGDGQYVLQRVFNVSILDRDAASPSSP